ncbi:DUF1272 domain-containing protein [Pseudomonas akapageensis]|uniref:DUF1272 domain-containing protein n=1 Tax=Pseudomonas akapageensis TaxID=2609961 RepID=UPI00140C8343|nr:DUF1272 domain-containing protein [Pseudomonas akapageensis]
MLELRPFCECCGADLPGDSQDAFICSYECTFCRECSENWLVGRCPNCAGELMPRPPRVGTALLKNPASTLRIVKAQGCARTSA